MSGLLIETDETQLAQAVEMFEAVVAAQPFDLQSLEVLKEAYLKLGRQSDFLHTSKRIAEACTHLGQYSSAILEYEGLLQHAPDSQEILSALAEIQSKANTVVDSDAVGAGAARVAAGFQAGHSAATTADSDLEDGYSDFYRIFVDGKITAAAEFDLCWGQSAKAVGKGEIAEPLIQVLADRGTVPVDRSLTLLSQKSRRPFLPLEKYDFNLEVIRRFPARHCRRWCILPFDQMSKTILVATANPFNQQAAHEIEASTEHRLVWYLALPQEITKAIQKVFRS